MGGVREQPALVGSIAVLAIAPMGLGGTHGNKVIVTHGSNVLRTKGHQRLRPT